MSADLPERLRALHAGRRYHFTPSGQGGAQQESAFAIVATEARLHDLLDAADMLEIRQSDAETLAKALADEVREAAHAEMATCMASGDDQMIIAANRAVRNMCERLGVRL